MERIVTALADQHAELFELLAPLEDADWQRPSRCDGWSVSDVLLHLAQTNELAVASVQGRLAEAGAALAGGFSGGDDVDDAVDAMVARQRGEPGPAVRDRWRASAEGVERELAACEPSRRLLWVVGELTPRTLATTRLAESWIHAGDVAHALGVTLAPTDRLWHVARLAWRTLPYAFGLAGRQLTGPVAFELVAPSGEAWSFLPDEPALTTIRGDGAELCQVAARRLDPQDTGLRGDGPDTDAVLELVRTYA